jgi:poly-gamma-glutamate capsule biosynthesis protein CapA/YwtB (metallophosphatase superfamily)
VVRFDNRDSGRSTHLHAARSPDLAAALAGDLSSATYTLSDMAADSAGLLDALRHRVVGSPAYPTEPAHVAEIAGLAYDRDHDAIARQAVASVASGDRTGLLKSLDIPTLVIQAPTRPCATA